MNHDRIINGINNLAGKNLVNIVIAGLVVVMILSLIITTDFIKVRKLILFYALISILLSIVITKISKKNQAITLDKLQGQKELQQEMTKTESKEITKKLIDKHNPLISKFLEILDEKGIHLIEDIEKKLISKGNAYYVLESGEKTPAKVKKEIKNTSIFADYVLSLKEENAFRVKVPGLSAFIIFKDGALDYNSFVEKYYQYLEETKQKILPTISDTEVRWFRKTIKNKHPIIIVAQPYLLSLLLVLDMIEDRISKEQKEKISKLLVSMSKKQIRVYNIKISFMWDSITISETTKQELKKKEKEIEDKLKEQYNITKGNYFIDMLNKKDFAERMQQILIKLIPAIENEVGLNQLIRLIKDLQINMLGMSEDE